MKYLTGYAYVIIGFVRVLIIVYDICVTCIRRTFDNRFDINMWKIKIKKKRRKVCIFIQLFFTYFAYENWRFHFRSRAKQEMYYSFTTMDAFIVFVLLSIYEFLTENRISIVNVCGGFRLWVFSCWWIDGVIHSITVTLFII